MTYTANQPQPLYAAIAARIESETTKAPGKGQAPADKTTPYFVIHPEPDGGTDGTLADPDSDVFWIFRVVCVGDTLDQAQYGQGLIRTALLGWSPEVDGLSVGKIELDLGSGVLPDPDLQPSKFTSSDRFRLFTSPE